MDRTELQTDRQTDRQGDSYISPPYRYRVLHLKEVDIAYKWPPHQALLTFKVSPVFIFYEAGFYLISTTSLHIVRFKLLWSNHWELYKGI